MYAQYTFFGLKKQPGELEENSGITYNSIMLETTEPAARMKPFELARNNGFHNLSIINKNPDLIKAYPDSQGDNAVIVRLVLEPGKVKDRRARFGVSRTSLIETTSTAPRRVSTGSFDLTVLLATDGSLQEFLGRPDQESGAFTYTRPITSEDDPLYFPNAKEVYAIVYQLDEEGLEASVAGREIIVSKKPGVKANSPEIEVMGLETFDKLGLPDEIDMLATFWQWVGGRVMDRAGGYIMLTPEELALRPLVIAK